MANILIVDDEKDIRDLLGDILDDEGHDIQKVGHAQKAIDAVDKKQPDLVILDIWLKESHMDGIDILKYFKGAYPDLPVVIISGHGNVEIAVAAIKQGAFDFIEKPFNIDQLIVVVNRALELSFLRRNAHKVSDEFTVVANMLGESNVMKNLRSQLDKLAKTQSRVMFHGPAGSGKEEAARYLHAQSDRADGPFISISSALLTAADVERQLLGFEEGSKVHYGLLERAHGGTLFFDEISDMPWETQGKILRIINNSSFERVGSQQTHSVDIRFMSATKEDLLMRINSEQFREELYHRLNVVPIDIPPLVSRLDDMPVLAKHFVQTICETENLAPRDLSEDAIQALQTQNWRGNIRELKNRLEHALILSENSAQIEADDIRSDDPVEEEGQLSSEYLFLPLREARELFEKRYLGSQILRFGGNISKTANFIGMERSALHRKMKSLDINGHDAKNR